MKASQIVDLTSLVRRDGPPKGTSGASAAPGFAHGTLGRVQQRLVILSTLRLGAGLLLALQLARTDTAGALGPWVLGWLLVSALAVKTSALLRPDLVTKQDLRPWPSSDRLEAAMAAVDAVAFVAVAVTAPAPNGYGPVAVLGLVLLAQAPLRWGRWGVVLVVAPLTAVIVWKPVGSSVTDSGQVALVTVIAGAAGLALWLRRLLRSRGAMAEHTAAMLSIVFDHSPTPGAIVCPTGRVLQVNAAMVRLCGSAAEELEGRRLVDLVHPDDTVILDRVMASVLRDEGRAGPAGQTMETRLVGPTDERWVRLVVGFVPASFGYPVQLVVQAEDVAERRATTARLEHEATHDSLTGLPNRRSVHRDLQRLTAPGDGGEGATGARRGALVLIDLDGFKAVNDAFGHQAGDELLVLAADRMQGSLLGGEVAGRLSGDELVVVAERVEGDEGALRLGERVMAALVGPAHLDAGDVALRASAGVARIHDGDDPPSVMRRADAALYRAKRAGGGRLELALSARTAPARTAGARIGPTPAGLR